MMYEHAGAQPPRGDWRYGGAVRPPSGLFPSGPARPTYREPFPARGGAVTIGLAGGLLWMLVFGLLGTSLRGYAWWSLVAGALAWLVALLLARLGDRGVAVGIGMGVAVGWSGAAVAVAVRWAGAGDWPLW